VVRMSMQYAQPVMCEARSLTSSIHNGSLGVNPCSSSGSDPTCSNTKNRTGRFSNNFVKMRHDSSKRALAEAPANHDQVRLLLNCFLANRPCYTPAEYFMRCAGAALILPGNESVIRFSDQMRLAGFHHRDE